MVTEQFWDDVAEIVSVLQSPYNATKEMQRIGYGISDFYISWTRMQKSLTRLILNSKFDLANVLIEKMDIRAPSLKFQSMKAKMPTTSEHQ